MYQESWRKNFRHKTFRKGQDTAIESAAAALDRGEKFIISELPTGVGKSDAAMALAKTANSAFITSSQNILLDQYKRDFGNDRDFRLIKGRKNYTCKSIKFKSCEAGAIGKCTNYALHSDLPTCTYKIERDAAIKSKVVVTNTSYFAVGCKGEKWPQRNIAIVDEAHNLANEILTLTVMEISESELTRMRISRTIPSRLTKRPEVPTDEFRKYLDSLNDELTFSLVDDENRLNFDNDVLEKMEDLSKKVQWFIASVDAGVRWVVDFNTHLRNGATLVAKPLDTAYFAENLFFTEQASQYVLQSATIVDFKQYAKELGISKAHTIRRRSPFDLSKRPIYDMAIGNMARGGIDDSLPKIAATVQEILKKRPDAKGIVHTGSYAVQKYLEDKFIMQSRCYFPKPGSRQEAIDSHFSSKEPTVLFSPSLTEGIDGRGDFLRFQIICKVPYPFLGDRRVKIKANEDWNWYNYQTAKTLIQAVGRGMRSEDDWCENFVLDSGFSKFLNKYDLPKDFVDSIKSASDGIKALK